MSDQLGSILPSVLVLGVAAAVALRLTLTRGWAEEYRHHLRGAVQIALLAVLAQAVHFTEELATGFDERFPALFGLAPMSPQFFVTFNIAWLVVWIASVWGLATRHRAALFPLWFLAIGGAMNGVAHPSMALLAEGYFPGLVTSPLVGVLGILLLRRLLAITYRATSPSGTT